MIFNIRNRGWGRFLFLKTIVLIFIAAIYINSTQHPINEIHNLNQQLYQIKSDDYKIEPERFFLFEELGISTELTSFGAVDNVSAKYFILDEIEKRKSADFRLFRLLHILDDSLSCQKIDEWKNTSFHRKFEAKQSDPDFLELLNRNEYDLFVKAAPYMETAQEVSRITGLDEKLFLSLFFAESNLTHFARSSLDRESWGLIMSPQDALGLAQITDSGFQLIDNEYALRKKILKKKKKIWESYENGKSLDTISETLNVGKNYILHVLQSNDVDISAYDVEEGVTDIYQLKFPDVEAAAEYDNMIEISFSALNQLLGGGYIDKMRYQREPLYAFSVGAAYLYLDYIYFANHPKIHVEDNELLEVCVAAYNRGRYGTENDLIQNRAYWRHRKYRETRGHWKNFQQAYDIFTSIDEKENQAIDSKVVKENLVM
jgi:hypothetical protein